jgi:hypothetical protein
MSSSLILSAASEIFSPEAWRFRQSQSACGAVV